MAAAFAAVVTTFTNWLLSLISAGATNFGDTKFGLFLTALVSFLVIAAVAYFFIVTHTKKLRRVSESSRPRLRTPTTSCCLRRSATCSPPVKAAPFDPAAPFELATQQCASPKGRAWARPVEGETQHKPRRLCKMSVTLATQPVLFIQGAGGIAHQREGSDRLPACLAQGTRHRLVAEIAIHARC